MGKNAIIATMMIFDVIPKPNQMMNSGISATFGTTCEATMTGRIACSSHDHAPEQRAEADAEHDRDARSRRASRSA